MSTPPSPLLVSSPPPPPQNNAAKEQQGGEGGGMAAGYPQLRSLFTFMSEVHVRVLSLHGGRRARASLSVKN